MTSTTSSNRIQNIDIVRGLAILGILLVNMAHFSYPDLYLMIDNFLAEQWSNLDHLTNAILDMFVQMKFITMFSFLFGFSMILMMEKTLEKGQKFVPIYVRRLLALLLFGTIHAFFIWDGDILMDYALLGFLLLLFRKARPKTLLIWAVALYAVFAIPTAIGSFMPSQDSEKESEMQEEFAADSKKEAKQALHNYGEGSFMDIARQRIHDRQHYMSMNGMASLNPFLYFLANIPYFSMFLLGAYFAKKRILHRPGDHKGLLKKIFFTGLTIGLPLNVLYVIWDNEGLLLIGAPFLMLFYVTSVIFLINRNWGKKLLIPFAAVGKTAFTNYIMQSVIATLIFYNFGLGLYGKVNPFLGLFISLAIFTLQLVISNLWLRKFRFGPLEWIWRMMTYLKGSALK